MNQQVQGIAEPVVPRTRERKRDEVDYWCEDWATVKRKVAGIVLPKMLTTREILGAMRSTLGSVKEEGEGASYTKDSQNWPEVYSKMGLMIQRCYVTMGPRLKEMMMAHYVVDIPQIPLKMRAAYLDVSVPAYWARVSQLKTYIQGYIAATAPPDEEFDR